MSLATDAAVVKSAFAGENTSCYASSGYPTPCGMFYSAPNTQAPPARTEDSGTYARRMMRCA